MRNLFENAKWLTVARSGEAVPHQPQELAVKGSQKKVRDPTTGKEVVIEDVNREMIKNVEDPVVRLPVAVQLW